MYIHTHPDWPNFTWDDRDIHPALRQFEDAQTALHTRLSALGAHIAREAQADALTAEIIGSAAIEGVLLNRSSVQSSIGRHLGIAGYEHGYTPAKTQSFVDVVTDAVTNPKRPLTAARLFDWHRDIMASEPTPHPNIAIGAWRATEVRVKRGKETLYQAPAPARVPAEMARFLAWFADTSPRFPPLLASGIAHLWFEYIHPFGDGNGRTGRAIGELALSRPLPSDAPRLHCLSAQIHEDRGGYYFMLNRHARAANGTNLNLWLQWYAATATHAIHTASARLECIVQKTRYFDKINRASLNQRQADMISHMLEPGWNTAAGLTARDYAARQQCMLTTAEREIRELAQRKILLPSSRPPYHLQTNPDAIAPPPPPKKNPAPRGASNALNPASTTLTAPSPSNGGSGRT